VYTGSVDALVKITKNHGIKALFRGQGPSTVREGTGLMFYFTTIEAITELLTPAGITSKKDLPFYVPFFAGGIGGATYWMFNYPFDYVKTLMQSDKFGEFRYKNMLDCFRQQYAEYGIKTFYKGYIICMMRSFPVNAAAMVTYRLMQRISGVASH
jgi:solute carrier family 25 carnitine/acylcarnitine transporter 20/29